MPPSLLLATQAMISMPYSTARGDPMLNGIHTSIAGFSNDVAEGWRVFENGHLNSWRVIEDRSDNIVLEVSR